MRKTIPYNSSSAPRFLQAPFGWLGVATFVVVLSLAVTSMGQSRASVTTGVAPRFGRPVVERATASVSTLEHSPKRVEGFAEPYRTIAIASGTQAGIIRQIHVTEGQAVTENQLLLEMDTNVLQASLEIAAFRSQMRGKLDAARTEAQLRSSRLTKLQQLHAEGHATSGEIERAVSDLAAAQAGVQMAEEEQQLYRLECERIEAHIRQRQFHSPMDGVVTEILGREGSTMLNADHLLTVVTLSQLRLRFAVPANQATQMLPGQSVRILLPDLGDQIEGIVEITSPLEDPERQTVEISILIDNQQNQYRSGMRAVLQLP